MSNKVQAHLQLGRIGTTTVEFEHRGTTPMTISLDMDAWNDMGSPMRITVLVVSQSKARQPQAVG